MNEQQQSPTTTTITDAASWTEPFKRQMLACMLRKGLEVPTAAFGTTLSPQKRIALVINKYRDQYNDQPTAEIIDELMQREVDRLGDEEKKAVVQEWVWVAETEVPDNPRFVEEQVNLWIGYERIKQALFSAGDALGSVNQQSLDAASKLLDDALAPARSNGKASLQAVSLGNFFARIVDAPITWVWQPYLGASMFALLTAYTKIGKSTFSYPLALAISRGQEFLGYRTTQSRVLILAVEENPRTVRQRLARFGATAADPIYVHPTRLKSSSAVIQEIRAFIKKEGIGLVIIDTISRFWTVKDENDNAAVLREAETLLDLAQETGACVLALHHDGKSESSRASRGASSLPGLADVILTLKRIKDRDTRQRRLLAEGREDATPSRLDIELDGDTWRVVEISDDEPPATPGPSDTELVLAALSRETPISREEIDSKTGLTRERVLAALKTLMDQGQVVREGGSKNSRYRLA